MELAERLHCQAAQTPMTAASMLFAPMKELPHTTMRPQPPSETNQTWRSELGFLGHRSGHSWERRSCGQKLCPNLLIKLFYKKREKSYIQNYTLGINSLKMLSARVDPNAGFSFNLDKDAQRRCMLVLKDTCISARSISLTRWER